MKWSLNTYQTGQDWDLDRLIEITRAAGYHGIEFLMDFGQKHGLEWDTPWEHCALVKEKMAAAGLEFASLTSCQVFHSSDPAERAASVERVKRVVDMAGKFGCPHVRVLGDRLPENDAEKPAVIQQVGECLAALGDYAAPHGIVVSMEMHGSFTLPDYSIQAMKVANRPNVGLVFNCVWLGHEGGPIEAYHERFAKWITMVHTHAVENPEQFEYYREMFQLLRRDGFDGYISNESAYTGPDPEKVLALYVALFRALAGE